MPTQVAQRVLWTSAPKRRSTALRAGPTWTLRSGTETVCIELLLVCCLRLTLVRSASASPLLASALAVGLLSPSPCKHPGGACSISSPGTLIVLGNRGNQRQHIMYVERRQDGGIKMYRQGPAPPPPPPPPHPPPTASSSTPPAPPLDTVPVICCRDWTYFRISVSRAGGGLSVVGRAFVLILIHSTNMPGFAVSPGRSARSAAAGVGVAKAKSEKRKRVARKTRATRFWLFFLAFYIHESQKRAQNQTKTKTRIASRPPETLYCAREPPWSLR